MGHNAHLWPRCYKTLSKWNYLPKYSDWYTNKMKHALTHNTNLKFFTSLAIWCLTFVWTNEKSYRNHLSLNSKLMLMSQSSHLKFLKHAMYSVWFTHYIFTEMWLCCPNTLVGSGFVFWYLLWCPIYNLILQSNVGQNIYPLGNWQRLRLFFCFNSQRRNRCIPQIREKNNAITTQTCNKVPSPSITDNRDLLHLPKSFSRAACSSWAA